MAQFKITPKTTKEDLLNVLKTNAKLVNKKDKTMGQQVSYTTKHSDKATRKDVVDLVKEVMTLLGDTFVVPAVAETKQTENSVKKPAPKTKEDEEQTTETEDEEKSPKAEKPKKSPKEDAVAVLETKVAQLAKMFPDTITIEGETFNIDHEVKTLEDLNTDGKEFEFAFYWTKRHLKQFPYFSGLPQPKSFPNDLDTAQLIYVSDSGVVAYAVSDRHEALYSIYPKDLEEVEGLRFCNGIEFQIYSKPATEE